MATDPFGSAWWIERVHDDLFLQTKLQAVLFTGKTRFQDVAIIETAAFGKTLILDGKTQSAAIDEFVYHEALAHPALLLHPNPKRVFIGGGGEGATLREVLRHKSVEEAVMVDIDGDLVELCREHLPEWHAGAFDDARTVLAPGDARAALEQSKSKYDVIVIDVTDPAEAGPSLPIFTKSFYEMALERLTPDGVLVTQAGPTALGMTQVHGPIVHTMRAAAGQVFPYRANVISFGCEWGFALVSKGATPDSLSPEEVDRRIAKRVRGALRFVDGVSWPGLFSAPRWLRAALAGETTVLTEDTQVFLA